jgi:hypothetical protein
VVAGRRRPRRAVQSAWLWGLSLFLGLAPRGHAQEALAVYAEDIFLEAVPGQEGLHLFIRKKPGISSVLLMESVRDPAGQRESYSYQSLEWNGVNGGRLLMDSSPEAHPLLGEVFHIYVPPVVTYGAPDTRHDTFAIGEGFYVNIRAFALPDCLGDFRDNPFSLTWQVPEFPDPESGVEPDPETPPDLPPDLPPDPETPPPEPQPPAEVPVFAPLIQVRGGLAIFFPGPEGKKLALKNNYDPVGSVTLTNWFTKNWGLSLGFDRDPLLMNRLFARAAWNTDFIGIEAGPCFGLLNSKTGQLSPGLSLVLLARISRWNFFSSFRWDGSPGKDPGGPGDYVQTYSEIKAGVALPFGGLILSLTDRRFTIRDEFDTDIISQWIRCNAAVEIAPPLNPLELRVDLGYQRLQWAYYLDPQGYGYWNVYTGLELSRRIKSVTLFFGLEAPLYPFVYPRIKNLADPQSPFLGQIELGLSWALPSP